MLILARYDGESIVINGNIIVKVVRRQGKRTLLGIEAPEEVSVFRQELIENPTAPRGYRPGRDDLEVDDV
jgi:carbon storage regulator